MVRQASTKVQNLIEPVVSGLGYECVGIEYVAQGKNSVLRIYIDKPHGIGVTDCEKVSRQVSAVLDVEDPLPGQYALEVSSPGLDRPLFMPEHFEKNIGSKAQLRLDAYKDGRKKFTGELKSVADGVVTIEVDGEEFDITFDEIEQARLVPEF